MILTGNSISAAVRASEITLEPFSEQKVTTNSYDLTLGDNLVIYEDEILDPKIKPKTREFRIADEGHVMNRGDFLLGSSQELVGSDHYVPIVHAKSSIARLGLFIHITSGLFDIGGICNVTFHLYSTMPIRIFRGMPIAQVTFWKTYGEIDLYKGKYKGDRGIAPSRIYRDFAMK